MQHPGELRGERSIGGTAGQREQEGFGEGVRHRPARHLQDSPIPSHPGEDATRAWLTPLRGASRVLAGWRRLVPGRDERRARPTDPEWHPTHRDRVAGVAQGDGPALRQVVQADVVEVRRRMREVAMACHRQKGRPRPERRGRHDLGVEHRDLRLDVRQGEAGFGEALAVKVGDPREIGLPHFDRRAGPPSIGVEVADRPACGVTDADNRSVGVVPGHADAIGEVAIGQLSIGGLSQKEGRAGAVPHDATPHTVFHQGTAGGVPVSVGCRQHDAAPARVHDFEVGQFRPEVEKHHPVLPGSTAGSLDPQARDPGAAARRRPCRPGFRGDDRPVLGPAQDGGPEPLQAGV